jgi:hypothetical protein
VFVRGEVRNVEWLKARVALFHWAGLRDGAAFPADEMEAYFDEREAFRDVSPPPRWLTASVPPSSPGACPRSLEAREVLRRLASHTSGVAEPTRRELDCICSALLELRCLAANPVRLTKAREETAAWRSFLRTVPEAVPFLVRMRRAVTRELDIAFLRLRRFPDEQWMQPTALGNRLAALDDYAGKRYGIDTSTMLTRVMGVASADERSEIADAQLRVEVLVLLAAALLLLAAAIVGAWWRAEPIRPYRVDWRTIGTILALVTTSTLSYRAAITAFGAVQERVERLVDLRRLDVLSALGYQAPETVAEEKQQFEELHRFFTMATPRAADRKLKPGK